MLRSLLVAVAFALVPLSARSAEDASKPEAVVGTKAPALKLPGLDGKSYAFDSLRGKAATVVVFVSFECPVSNSYVAPLQELARTHGEKGVSVVLVCPTDDAPEAVAKAAAGFKLAVPVLLDAKKELAAGLKAIATPEGFVLDADGMVRYRGRIDDAYSARLKRNQQVTSHDLEDALAAVLAGKSVAKAVTKPIGCGIDLEPAAPVEPKAGAVTYYKDVAAILNNHCVVCHRPGEVGPFSLTTYNQARRWASDIKDITAQKHMPPWMPAGDGVALRGARKMTAGEVATLAAWADAGAPEGDPKEAQKSPTFSGGWRHGKPDMILTAGDDFHLAATGSDLFRVFVLPTGLTENKWVIGYEVKPGNPRVVHHTLHFFDTSGQGRELELQQQKRDKAASKELPDRGPGYTASMGVGFIARGGKKNEPTFGAVGGWAPGQTPQFLPAGAGWRLPKGSDFLIQTHYHRNGQSSTDRTQIGLYFAKAPIEQPWQTVIVDGMKPAEKIPAGASNHVSRGALYLHTDAVLHSVLPHMHLLGKSVKVTMTPPNGQPVVLVDIPHWDYRWQETYWFQQPITAKAGTKIEIEAVFDNSAENPNNPNSPPRDVFVGEKTTDEMLFGFLGATSTKTPWEKVRASSLPPAGIAFEPPVKGQLTPVLERRLGQWDMDLTAKARTGSESKITGKDLAEKAFDGTYLRIHADTDREGSETYELVTFDPEKKMYRMWTYSSQGAIYSWDGKWNEKTKTLTWEGDLPSGLTGVLHWKFAADDKIDQELIIKLGPFAAFNVSGVLSRKAK